MLHCVLFTFVDVLVEVLFPVYNFETLLDIAMKQRAEQTRDMISENFINIGSAV